MNNPLLATATYAEGGKCYSIRVEGGLHYIRGNSAPYFSITADIRENGRECMGGCCHDEIEKRFPGKFGDLIALHLSDIDGVPMYAEANGWYSLAPAMGGLGEKYTAGNSKRHFPKAEIDPAKPWATTDYREPTAQECLQIFADHCRVQLWEAQALVDKITAEAGRDTPLGRYMVPAQARAIWRQACENMRPRWKREAEACIARLGLKV